MDGLKNYWGEPNDRPHKVEGSCISKTLNAAMTGAAAGTIHGAVTLAWFPDPITSEKRFGGVLGKSDGRQVLRALARPSFLMATAGATFAVIECSAETLRGKDDSWNSMIGGMAAGAFIGSMTKRADIMTSTAFAMGLFMLAVDYTGPIDGQYKMRDTTNKKMYGVLPNTHKEGPELSALKEKYPKFNHC
mmetsp:Transcript_2393/g.2593  ORF Transcript_2393/g.2593 Transcript_2393/m.2593 type:complete len:190 (-) Transcript_2393:174-743(-)|eukprot:CAMPEP_0198248304 /NCGR_PEP_ID=MMETSP1447-20131203/58_1 /TAXON_ID=420782 /ORGANISM="Chaetoceros dichaeta, Strain CCMP1751" /LENGTH=189 /DNA_ID=CAMNT_0043932647 /DNA_START=65 /DNA_END=634 /DNA_ORIENTATION=+